VDVLGDRADLVLREPAERVLDELEVAVEVARAVLPGERREERRIAIGREELARLVEGAHVYAPRVLAPEHPRREVVHRIGHERARDARLDLALGAIVEQRACDLDRGGRVCEVVGQDLVVVDRARRGECTGAGGDGAVGDVDRRGGAGEIGRAHPRETTCGSPRARHPDRSAARRRGRAG
jgi:hypothetical protein